MQKSLAYRLVRHFGKLPLSGKVAAIVFMTIMLWAIASEPILLLPLTFLILVGILIRLLWKKISSVTSRGSNFNKNSQNINIAKPYDDFNKNASQSSDYDQDNWEGNFWEVEQPFTGTATLRIDYEDGTGHKTKRVIDIRKYGTAYYGDIIMAYCRMRNAPRTFRTDRIKHCVDVDTGEIIRDVFTYLREKYERSPEHKRDTLLENEYDTLRVLLYIGKADGQLRAEEKTIIRETCRALANDSRITDVMIDELFYNLQIPTIHAFKLAVGRLVKKGTQAYAVVMNAAEAMVATQKTVHPSEKEALEYMRKRHPNIVNIAI